MNKFRPISINNMIPKINCSKRNLHHGFQKSHYKYNWPTTWSVCAGMDANHHLNLFNISEHGKERKIKCSRKWASINSTADLLSLCFSFSSSKSFLYLSTCLSFSFLSVHWAKLALSLSLFVKAEDYKCLLFMPIKGRALCHASLYSNIHTHCNAIKHSLEISLL